MNARHTGHNVQYVDTYVHENGIEYRTNTLRCLDCDEDANAPAWTPTLRYRIARLLDRVPVVGVFWASIIEDVSLWEAVDVLSFRYLDDRLFKSR